MSTYTISAVSDQVRAWNTKAGAPWKSYRVTLRNQDGQELEGVEISRNAGASAPTTGEVVEGSVKRTDYGPKLDEPRKGGGGGGRAKPPEERRSIAMQSSLARGVEITRLAVDSGVWKPADLEDAVNAAVVAGDAFYQRVMKAEAGS